MIKLFRDYVFHQVDENGAPWIDMSHIIQCLNKVSVRCDKQSTCYEMGDLCLSGSIIRKSIFIFYERAENHKAKEWMFKSFK